MAMPQAKNGDYRTLSAYNQRALSKNLALAARYGVTNYKPGMSISSGSTSSSSVTKSPDYTKEINALYDPLLTASDNSLAANKAGLADEFSGLATRLKETAGKSEQGLTESMNRYGLLESGRNAAGIGKIQENLSSDIGKADIQRAIQEAQLVLDHANYNSTVGLQKLSATQGLDSASLQRDAQKFAQDMDLKKWEKDLTYAKNQGDLLLNADFRTLLTKNPDLAKQLLQSYGITVA